ncbi:DUF4124 domain-containing protein [Acinetobacter wanghuae]|uniref:DUF4124 domain-containing protein n=1 Tax=Acinetobacter wanghuae TaxID=2662362 RepID=UPI003AF91134
MPKLLSSCIGLSCAVLLSSVSSTSFATDYYKWVDSKGTTHYTKTPPPASAKKKAKVETYGWKNSAPTLPRTAEQPADESNTPQQVPVQQSTPQPAESEQAAPAETTTPTV